MERQLGRAFLVREGIKSFSSLRAPHLHWTRYHTKNQPQPVVAETIYSPAAPVPLLSLRSGCLAGLCPPPPPPPPPPLPICVPPPPLTGRPPKRAAGYWFCANSSQSFFVRSPISFPESPRLRFLNHGKRCVSQFQTRGSEVNRPRNMRSLAWRVRWRHRRHPPSACAARTLLPIVIGGPVVSVELDHNMRDSLQLLDYPLSSTPANPAG